MKNRLLAVLIATILLLTSIQLKAQIGINTDGASPDPSAMLDVKSTVKGLLPPRVALTAINVAAPVSTPVAVGLLVYNTATAGTAPNNVAAGYYCWNGTKWIPVLAPQGANIGDMQYWNGTQWVRVPVGNNGQVLTLNNGVPSWGGIQLPILTTTDVTGIASGLAISGGNITSDGGSPVIARGVCWSTAVSPTIASSHTIDGIGTNLFVSNLSGLNPKTVYYIRAYATNILGTSYGNQLTFTTLPNLPVLTTTTVTSITQTTAMSGGVVISDGADPVTARGVCWSTSPNPTTTNSFTVNGTGTGPFTSNLTGLTGNTLYYLRAYATNSAGTAYGNQQTFSSAPTLANITTTVVTGIAQTTATSGGEVIGNGGTDVFFRGMCWSTSPNPTISNSHTTDGSGNGLFISYITGLTLNTTYYARAFAVNSVGTSYGNEFIFTTLGVITLTTVSISTVTPTSAASGGNITNDGGAAVTARGVCWGTSSNPTIATNSTSDGAGTGSFVSNLSGLAGNTLYYVRSYAVNSSGAFYGNQLTFTTSNSTIPSVTTGTITNISQNTAIVGGQVTSNGGVNVTARGVCWSTTPNPLATGSHTTNGTGTGVFIANLTSLTTNTLYYLRAYATNSVGTAYGNEITFSTLPNPVLPAIITTAVTNISQTTATGGGDVTGDGSAIVSFRGICWSTTPNPTITNSHTTDGGGTGAFVSSITGLVSNTLYYVRAYAVNSVGTAYGNEVTFVTSLVITTNAVSAITQVSAVSGGNITAGGGATISSKGICWSVTANPTVAGSHTTEGTGTGAFTSNMTGLTVMTLYYVRAYATNGSGTYYGNQQTFTTSPLLPTLTTAAVSLITLTTATSGGNVTADGGATVNARGVCWNTAPTPTTANSKTIDGNGTGIFASNLTGLTPNMIYYVRAYATSSAGTAYGNEIAFTTLLNPVIPVVTTASITNLGQSSCTGGGIVTSDGGAVVTFRGVCWGTSPNPTITNSHTTDGNGTGVFVSSITGLTPNTLYYFRSYAVNGIGTSYGNELNVTTPPECGLSITVSHVAGTIAPITKTVSYGTVTNIPGEPNKCWITKNLGADHQAATVSDTSEASAGWYWQFNRKQGYKHDGTIRTPNTTWIDNISEIAEWDAANDPCKLELGIEWHIPSFTEWTNVDAVGNWTEWNGPWNSALKLHAAGSLLYQDGTLNTRGVYGKYWSNAQYSATEGWRLYFESANCLMNETGYKMNGFSLRCLRTY
jgi:hypothetical protein